MKDQIHFDLLSNRKKRTHFLFVGIQTEFLTDVLDFMDKHALPVILVLPTTIRLGSIPGMQLMGQNPNSPISIIHVYSKAPEAEWEAHRTVFTAWHASVMAERQKAGNGLVKVTPGQAAAAGLDLSK